MWLPVGCVPFVIPLSLAACVSSCVQDGSMFKARVVHAPYFYLQIRVSQPCTNRLKPLASAAAAAWRLH